MVAPEEWPPETAKLLLKAEADTDIKTPEGAMALKWAAEGGHAQIVELLKRAGAEE
jgi:ankyrin repeat protein